MSQFSSNWFRRLWGTLNSWTKSSNIWPATSSWKFVSCILTKLKASWQFSKTSQATLSRPLNSHLTVKHIPKNFSNASILSEPRAHWNLLYGTARPRPARQGDQYCLYILKIMFFFSQYLREGLKKYINKWMDLSIQAGWLGSVVGQNPSKTKFLKMLQTT